MINPNTIISGIKQSVDMWEKHKKSSKHYDNKKGYDVIDICKDYNLNFNRGNVIKYVCRAGKKDDEIQDLKKALDYIKKEIKSLENQKETSLIKAGWIVPTRKGNVMVYADENKRITKDPEDNGYWIVE